MKIRKLLIMEKGCPFNNFGPCRKNECGFFMETEHDNPMRSCVFHIALMQSLDLQDLMLSSVQFLKPYAVPGEALDPVQRQTLDRMMMHRKNLEERADWLDRFYSVKPKPVRRGKKKS